MCWQDAALLWKQVTVAIELQRLCIAAGQLLQSLLRAGHGSNGIYLFCLEGGREGSRFYGRINRENQVRAVLQAYTPSSAIHTVGKGFHAVATVGSRLVNP
ncbi:hypothetical protein D3C76_1129000 [compost metagenome]